MVYPILEKHKMVVIWEHSLWSRFRCAVVRRKGLEWNILLTDGTDDIDGSLLQCKWHSGSLLFRLDLVEPDDAVHRSTLREISDRATTGLPLQAF